MDDFGEDLDDAVHVLVRGVVAAEAEADRAVDGGERDVHCPHHVGGLQGTGGAGRTASRRRCPGPELVQDAFALDVVARDVQRVRSRRGAPSR